MERRHGGHDMSGMSTEGSMSTNERLSHAYWYGIIAVIGLLTAIRLLRLSESKRRRAAQRRDPSVVASRPQNSLAQAYATATATIREIAYPQPVYFTGRLGKYFSPLPVGRWVLLVGYWTVLLCFLWTNTIIGRNDERWAYRWETVGYRAAWVSICQIPFIYLLSCKFNPISLLTGISYERFNWLHRWAARTVFMTIIVHWSYFYTQWDRADFVKYQLQMMPMTKYGFGAWGVIGWMVLTGFGFVRAQKYEIFVAQHICAAATLLWLLWAHLPSKAAYWIWIAVGFVVFDWSCRIVWVLLRNTHALSGLKSTKPGYLVELELLAGDMVRLTVRDADFTWRPGQHAYISIPRLRPLEFHPFTIANASTGDKRLTMVVKAHSGFTKTLVRAARERRPEPEPYRAFISGPWGGPPDLLHYDTVVLIACASGVSFTVPLVQDLVQKEGCARSIVFHWIIREKEHLSWYEEAVRQVFEGAASSQTRLQIVVHVSRSAPEIAVAQSTQEPSKESKAELTVDSESANSFGSDSLAALDSEKTLLSHGSSWRQSNGRPTVESMIRPPVEAALGETAVVVCGGVPVTAEARTFVASLSDERAVHKGSGAQAIFLFTESYGW